MTRSKRRRSAHRPSLFRRSKEALSRYAEGFDPSTLGRYVERDAPRVYSVLLRERAGQAEGRKGADRFFLVVRLLFQSISEKLSPPRRLIFLLSLAAAALAMIDIRFTWREANFEFSPGSTLYVVAIAGLLYLLAGELVERVLVRDELQVARQIQQELLPRTPPILSGWAVAHSWRTAAEIGGDYHHFQTLPDGRQAIVVADASGHGMAAGLLMAIADTTLRIGLEQDPTPAAVADLLHRALHRAGNRRSFLTLFYGRLDPNSGELDYVCAGHPPPLIRRVDGSIDEPAIGSLPLGLRARAEPASGRLVLAPGELLVLFSDGLFEALGAGGGAFGHDRVRAEIAAGGSAAQVHDRLLAAHRRHVGEEALDDDLTLVVVERLPEAGAALQ